MFGSEESGEIRCWMGWKQDVEQRLGRARKVWWKVKYQGVRCQRRCRQGSWRHVWKVGCCLIAR